MSELHKWLKGNLGPQCLAPCTGTDFKALSAAVAIVDLYLYDFDGYGLEAFRSVVLKMQPSTRHLAYHAIAMVMDWSDRAKLWKAAGLPLQEFGKCKAESFAGSL